MKLNVYRLCFILFSGFCTVQTSVSIAQNRTYQVPPTSSTSANVPVISDAKMEECVKNYNHATWLQEDIEKTYVNEYDKNSVDNYNEKVSRYSRMIDQFNRECAGKQSQSAYEAARKLNRR